MKIKNEKLMEALSEIGKDRSREREEIDALFEVDQAQGSEPRWRFEGAESHSETVEKVRVERDKLKPDGDEFRAMLVSQISQKIQSENRTVEETADVVSLEDRRQSRRRLVWVGSITSVALATAAALALVVFPRSATLRLPNYSLTVSSGLKDFRDDNPDSPGVPSFREGAILEIILRPEVPVEGDIEIATFLEKDGRFRPIPLPVEKDSSGALRLSGTIGEDLSIPPGAWTLWFAITAKGLMPEADDLGQGVSQFSKGVLKESGRLLKTQIEIVR